MGHIRGTSHPNNHRSLNRPLEAIRRTTAVVALAALTVGTTALADNLPKPVNHANWKLANRFTAEYIQQYTYSTAVTPHWINDTDSFWYSWRDSNGTKFYKVDAKARSKKPLFDAAKMAVMLSELVHKPYDTTNLPITNVTFNKDGKAFRFVVEGTRYEYDLATEKVKAVGKVGPNDPPEDGATPPAGQGRGLGRGGGQFRGGQGGPGGLGANFRNTSPDKKAYVYAQDENLYYAEVANEDKPIQLTKDGAQYYGYGAAAAGAREKRVRVNGQWSPDSKSFSVERRDSRKVKELYLVNSLATPRPALVTYKYSMPGDTDVTQTELYVFHRDTKQLQRMNVEKWKDQQLFDLHWTENSDHLRFARRDRLQRHIELCDIDMKINLIKPIITEATTSGFIGVQPVSYLKPGGDMLWWSERSGWGHYYVYSNDGKLKNEIAPGPFRTDSIVETDADKGYVWITGSGREQDQNPTFTHLYKAKIDGTDVTLLDEGDADHTSVVSPSKKFEIDNCSRVDMAPKSCLRDDRGKVILELEQEDLTRLMSTGWKMPETFKVKAEDGVTDIYGAMWKPFDFDKNKKYPIILNVYPGPQTESVNTTFSAGAGTQRLAQLGFIVIQIGNRGGNPKRSKAYDTFGYYNLRDYGLADKKAGVEQLAAKYPWIDIDRVGIFGHSGGGFMTAAAMLMPPYNEFFKVGVSSSGNHDNNVYNQNWSEQYHGLREVAGPPPVTGTGATGTGGAGAGTGVRGRRGGGGGGSSDDGFSVGASDDEDSIYDNYGDDSIGQTYQDAVILDRMLLPLTQQAEDPQQRGGRRGTGVGQGQRNGQTQTTQGQTNQNNQNVIDDGDGTGETHFEIHVPTNAEIAANLKGKLLLVHGDMDDNVHYAGTFRLIDALIRANKRFDYMLMPGKPHAYGDLQPYFNEMLYEYFCSHLMGDNYSGTADMKDKGQG